MSILSDTARGGAAGGIVSGMTGGAVGGPLGAAIGGGIGLLGSLFGGDSESEELQKKLMAQAAEMERLRPIYNQAGQQALSQQLMALGPANQMLGQMHGLAPGQGIMDLDAIGANPLPSEAFGPPEPEGQPPVASSFGGHPRVAQMQARAAANRAPAPEPSPAITFRGIL